MRGRPPTTVIPHSSKDVAGKAAHARGSRSQRSVASQFTTDARVTAQFLPPTAVTSLPPAPPPPALTRLLLGLVTATSAGGRATARTTAAARVAALALVAPLGRLAALLRRLAATAAATLLRFATGGGPGASPQFGDRQVELAPWHVHPHDRHLHHVADADPRPR